MPARATSDVEHPLPRLEPEHVDEEPDLLLRSLRERVPEVRRSEVSSNALNQGPDGTGGMSVTDEGRISSYGVRSFWAEPHSGLFYSSLPSMTSVALIEHRYPVARCQGEVLHSLASDRRGDLFAVPEHHLHCCHDMTFSYLLNRGSQLVSSAELHVQIP